MAQRVAVVTWSGLLNGDYGEAVELAVYADRSVQITGTFGAGGTCVIQGSNDGTNWATLADPQGNLLSHTDTKIEAILELTRYLRPYVSGGDGTTNLTATMVARGIQ
jgi:hypothetical protein